jgi:flagellar motor protein MotB
MIENKPTHQSKSDALNLQERPDYREQINTLQDQIKELRQEILKEREGRSSVGNAESVTVGQGVGGGPEGKEGLKWDTERFEEQRDPLGREPAKTRKEANEKEELSIAPMEETEGRISQGGQSDNNQADIRKPTFEESQSELSKTKVTDEVLADLKSLRNPGKETILIITLGSGLFWSGRVGGSRELDQAIRDAASRIKAYPDSIISVEGHTDSTPLRHGASRAYSDNMGLSLWRATNVATQLAELGIEPKRIRVKGYGETRPLAPNDTEFGRAKNRRVEIRVLNH